MLKKTRETRKEQRKTRKEQRKTTRETRKDNERDKERAEKDSEKADMLLESKYDKIAILRIQLVDSKANMCLNMRLLLLLVH